MKAERAARATVIALFVLVAGPATVGAVAQTPSQRAPAAPALHAIPPRPLWASAGARVAESLIGTLGAQRESRVRAELLRGNLPGFLRRLQPVRLAFGTRERAVRITLWVMPDYLAVGSDTDSLRLPMDLYTAAAVAQAFGMSLPTRPIVDAVWRQAAVKLTPSPMKPGPQMTGTRYFIEHDARIRSALGGRHPGAIVAGHKKDLVLTSLLERHSSRVAIYGWHRLDGTAIQPLSIVHGATYADYSHGVRLVSRRVEIDGEPRDLFEVMRDPRYARLLTGEEPAVDLERLLEQAAPAVVPAR